MGSYVSARGRSIAITVLVIVQLALLGLATIAWAIGAGMVERDSLGAVAAFGTAGALNGIDALVFTAATVVFLTWVYRAVANLPALGSMTCAFTPGGAVWAFFIPIVNLVWGHQVMATVWRESQPPAVNENGFYLPRKATLVHAWWTFYLVSIVVSIWLMFSQPSSVSGLSSFAASEVFLHLVRMTTALLFLIMIRAAQARQDEMWQDLERRRNVPQPTADALR